MLIKKHSNFKFGFGNLTLLDLLYLCLDKDFAYDEQPGEYECPCKHFRTEF